MEKLTDKQKITILSLLIVIIVLLGALLLVPSNSTTSSKLKNSDSGGKRTVMIYMAGNNLETNSGIASSDIDSINLDYVDFDNLNVLLYTGGTEEWHNFVENDENAIYLLTKDGFEKLESYDVTNMGNPETLANFINYSYDNYPADKYDIIFWNHGGAVNGAISDELSGDNLSLSEFDEAFSKTPFNEDNKLDSVTFRTCLTGTIEIATIFSKYSEVLNASEEVTIGNYSSRALEFLATLDQTDDGIEFGKKFIDSYVEWFDEVAGGSDYTMTYSIMDLTKVNQLNNDLESFITKVNLDSDYNKISKIRSNLFEYGAGNGYDMVDLYSLVNKLSYVDSTKAQNVLDDINEMVVYNKVNDDESHGVSIYFPYSGTRGVVEEFLYVYKENDLNENYYNFISEFQTLKSSNKTSSFASLSSTNTATVESGEEFKLQLSAEQQETFAKASYIIFEKKDNGYFAPVYKSSDYNLSDDGVLSTKLTNKMLAVTVNGESDLIFAIEEKNNTYLTTTQLSFFDEDAGNVFDYELYSTWATIAFDKNNKPYISSHKSTIKTDAGVYETIVDEEDFTTISFFKSTYKILDENGNYNPDWSSVGEYYLIEADVGGYSLSTSSLKDGDYYCVFAIYDTQNNLNYSNLVQIN